MNNLICKLDKSSICKYEIHKYQYPDIHILNRNVANSLAYGQGDEDLINKLKQQVNEYNNYLEFLSNVDGFITWLNLNGSCVNKNEVTDKYGKLISDKIFSLKKFGFSTDLKIMNDYLFYEDANPKYSVNLPTGEAVVFKLSNTDDSYPKLLNDKSLLWNWISDGRDFTFALWNILSSLNWIPETDFENEEKKNYSIFEFWGQSRLDVEADLNLIKCLKILEDTGYANRYVIQCEEYSPWLELRCADGELGLITLDNSFCKDPLIKEKFDLILNLEESMLKNNIYFLTNKDNKQYISSQPGTIGGHNKLKIYGKLDCPSANKYIAKGQYIKQRVFFENEGIAIQAGYRPCSVCMPEEYKQWKQS